MILVECSTLGKPFIQYHRSHTQKYILDIFVSYSVSTALISISKYYKFFFKGSLVPHITDIISILSSDINRQIASTQFLVRQSGSWQPLQ